MRGTIFILFSVILLITLGCKKDSASPKGGCRITNVIQPNALWGTDITFDYDDKGKMIRYEFPEIGIWANMSTISGNRVNSFYLNMPDNIDTYRNVIHYQFNNEGMIKDLPTSARRTVENIRNGVVVDVENRMDYTFEWNQNGNLIRMETKPFRPDDLGQILTISYNSEENPEIIDQVYTSEGMSGIGRMIAITEYDDNPSPYTAIPYWKFVHPSDPFSFMRDFEILDVLCKNNPITWEVFVNSPTTSGRSYTSNMKYDYKERGYPTMRIDGRLYGHTESYQRSGHFFSYSCD